MRAACSRCGASDPSQFSPSGAKRRVCRPCHAAYMRVWNARNATVVRDRHRAYKQKDGGRAYRNSQLKTQFGLTLAEYEHLEREQDGLCASCKEPETAFSHSAGRPKRLAVDHCHATGRVRGLLCSRCNTALGLLRDEPSIIRMLLRYTEETAMRIRVVKDTGKKPWALIVEENGVQIEKRDFTTQSAAEKARDKLCTDMWGS